MSRKTAREYCLRIAVLVVSTLIIVSGAVGHAAVGALQVAQNGVGDLLIYPYWTTADRNTRITLINSFAAKVFPERFIHSTTGHCSRRGSGQRGFAGPMDGLP